MDKRTYADRRESNIRYVTIRRNKIRLLAIEYLGGKCCFCGYHRCIAALDFHHLDEKSKAFTIRDGLTRSWERTKKELAKCILVCANCHREIHVGLLQPSVVMLNGKHRVNSGKPNALCNGNPEPIPAFGGAGAETR